MKKFKKRGIFLAGIIAISAMGMAGCGPTSSPTGPQGPITGDEPSFSGNLKIWWPGGSSTTEAAIQNAKAKYEELHPDVNIDIRFQSTPDFYLSYNMALMGNEYPDIAYIDHVYVQRLAYDGAIANLSTLGLDSLKDLYIDSLYTPNLYENELYGVPMSANVLTRVYNKALLTKVYGSEFEEDQLPNDWNSYIEIGDKIKEYNTKNNLTGNDQLYLTTVPAGTGAESMGAMYYLGMVGREGGKIMSDDLTEITIATEQNMSAATKIKQLGSGGYTTNTFSESKFETGKVAFIEMGPWKLLEYSRMETEGIDFEYAPIMPNVEGGPSTSCLGLYSLVLTQKSKNHALAADFMKFLTTDTTVQLEHNTVQYLMPTTKEAIADDYYKDPQWDVFVEQLNNVVARPGSAAWPAIEKNVAEFVTGLINGERDETYLYSLQAALEERLEDLE